MQYQPEHVEEALLIDTSQLVQALKAKRKLIAAISLGVALVVGIFSFIFFHEKYYAEGTLLSSPAELSHVVTDVAIGNALTRNDRVDSNPYKNQEELLKSKLIADQVFAAMKQEGIHPADPNPANLHGKVINASYIKGTDFIRISATADSPAKAQKIARAYLNSYLALMDKISFQPLKKQKELFTGQVASAETDLDAINTKIKDYQSAYGILDLEVESPDQVHELARLDSDANTVESGLAQKRAEVARLRQQLKLGGQDITRAISAVATGQNVMLNDLNTKLQDAQKEYQTKALTYAATNPEMEQLETQIHILQRQVTDQHIQTVGQTNKTNPPFIKDSVRTELVSRLALAESEVSAMQRRLQTTRSQYGRMRAGLHNLPQQQLEYAKLQLDRKNKEDVLTRLKQKLSELQIQETLAHQEQVVIDQPHATDHPLFPSRLHIIMLSGLAAAVLSALGVAVHSLVTNREIRPEFFEQALGLPILSVIPWLDEEEWQRYRSRGLLEVTASPGDPRLLRAYQNLALNLKAQRHLHKKNTFVTSAITQPSGCSVVLSNIAFCLAQSGENVLLIDANLREPCLHVAFHHNLDYETGLPEVINSLCEKLYKNDGSSPAELLPLITGAAVQSGVHPQLQYLNAGVAMENTFEFLNSKGFAALINTVRTHYDWVLIDAPPFLQAPDAAVLLGYTDGLILLVEHSADESQVLATKRKVERLNSRIAGTVLRHPKA